MLEVKRSVSLSDLATIERSARLTLWAIERINPAALRFSERQRLARILLRLEKVAGEAHDLLPLMPSNDNAELVNSNSELV